MSALMEDAWSDPLETPSFRASSAETVVQGVVVLLVGLPLVAAVEAARAVRRMTGWLRRWPMPASIVDLTTEEE